MHSTHKAFDLVPANMTYRWMRRLLPVMSAAFALVLRDGVAYGQAVDKLGNLDANRVPPVEAASPSATNQVADASISVPFAGNLPEYSAFEARRHVGENAVVTGRVSYIIRGAANCYLLFGDSNGPDADFRIWVSDNVAGPKFDVNSLENVSIAVSGKIEGRSPPTIKAAHTSQIVTESQRNPDQLDAALALAEKAVRANSSNAQAYYRRGLAREKRAALQQSRDGYYAAMDDYNRCFKLDSSKAEALVHIGDCYAALQDYVAAKNAWDRAIEASPEARELLKDSIAKEHDRYVYAAIHDLDKLTNLEPKNAALYYRKANLYLMDHATESANKNYQLAAELEPTNLAYGMKASHPMTPSKRPLTVEELKDMTIAAAAGLLGAGLTLAAMSDIEAAKAAKAQHERVRSIVEASGGTKIECPKCGGSGKTVDYRPNYSGSTNPYMWYSLESQQWENSHRASIDISKCERCGGMGLIDK